MSLALSVPGGLLYKPINTVQFWDIFYQEIHQKSQTAHSLHIKYGKLSTNRRGYKTMTVYVKPQFLTISNYIIFKLQLILNEH